MIERVAQIVYIGQGNVHYETPARREMVKSISKSIKLLLDFIEVRNRVERQDNQVERALMRQLVIAHVRLVQSDTLPHRFVFAFQLAPVNPQHFGRDIQSLKLKIARAMQQFNTDAPTAAGQF